MQKSKLDHRVQNQSVVSSGLESASLLPHGCRPMHFCSCGSSSVRVGVQCGEDWYCAYG
jgi:hypothetical protein